METLARQAALAFHNAWLVDELAARLRHIERQAEELAAARTRLRARDGERRRIERDLHDGAQQEIVAISAKLRLARSQLRRDPASADITLGELLTETGKCPRRTSTTGAPQVQRSRK